MNYHWILTLQTRDETKRGTFEGTYGATPGPTRESAYLDILATACRSKQIPEPVDVLFFSLEPDELGAR